MATIDLRRSRWAAIGAAVAVTLGTGGLFTASAAVGSGERATFVPITPCRIMDTRPGASNRGPRSTPIGADDTHTIAVVGTNGDCTIPADAVAVSLNVTALNSTSDSFLTIFPAGVTKPLTSSLNWRAGQAPTPNAVNVDLPADGRLSFFNFAGTVDVIADVTGYYVDHQHDDRYYTKAQVDAAIAALDPAAGSAGVLVVGPAEFVPETNGTDQYSITTSKLTMSSGSECFTAVVRLPDGAVVTGLEVTHVLTLANPQAYDLLEARFGQPSSAMAHIAASTSSGFPQTLTDVNIDSPDVDNDAFSYGLQACLATPVNFSGARILYTNP